MSKPIRIALVAEGVTDFAFIQAVLVALLPPERTFDFKLLQPEASVAFESGGAAGALGGGWRGVHKWCHQQVVSFEGLRDHPLLLNYDLLMIHLDADVASETPDPRYGIVPGLPCARPCPPAQDTTDALRQVLLGWGGETTLPPQVILCTPSKSTEAWVMAALFPEDKELSRKGWECYPKPEHRLAQQPKAVRIGKNLLDYQSHAAHFTLKWPSVVQRLSEANRFHSDLMAGLQAL